MPDRLYLSYRIRGFTGSTMLRHFETLLRLFPFSRLAGTSATLKIQPIEYAEPPLLEKAFPHPLDSNAVIEACREFENADCAYSLETWWDLWQFELDWSLAPARATLVCFGPEFSSESDDHLRVEFGLDSQFLPRPDLENSLYMVRSNIRSLLHFVHEAGGQLAVESVRLWSEGGENFAARLQEALDQAG